MAKDDETLSEKDVDQILAELDADETQAAEPGTEAEAPAEVEAQATDDPAAAASDEPSDESPDQPAADEAPSSADTTPTPSTTDAAAPEGGEPVPSEDEGSKREPFTVTVYGQPVEIPGAYREKDRKWVRIPVESWDRVVQPRLVEPRVIQEREVAHRREVQALTEQRTLRDTQAEGLLGKFDEIVKLADTDPAASLAKWEELVNEFPRFKLEQEKRYWEEQAKRPNAEAEERQRREMADQIDTEVRSSFEGYADEVLKLKDYQDVPAMRDDLVKALHRARFQLVRATGEKHPQTGLPMLTVDWPAFKEIVEDVAGLHRRFAQQLKTVEQAAKQNAARLAPRPVAPPAPGTPRSAKPAPGRKAGSEAKSYDDILAAAESITLDD